MGSAMCIRASFQAPWLRAMSVQEVRTSFETLSVWSVNSATWPTSLAALVAPSCARCADWAISVVATRCCSTAAAEAAASSPSWDTASRAAAYTHLTLPRPSAV